MTKNGNYLCIAMFFVSAMCFYMTSCNADTDSGSSGASGFYFDDKNTVRFVYYGDFEESDIQNVDVYDNNNIVQGHASNVTTNSKSKTGKIKLDCDMHSGWHVSFSIKGDKTKTLYY